MRLLMFLVLSRYELACKYRIISQISMYNWMQNYIFQYLWYCILIFLRTNYNLLWQVGWFFTWWVEGIITSSDSSLTQNIIRETIKVGEKKDGFFFCLSFLLRTFTNHRTVGEGERHFFNSSLPLPTASQTLRY